MYQQINLYQPIFRKQRHIFSGLTMLQGTGVVIVALMLVYLYGLWQVLGLEAEVVQLEGREKAFSAQLARLDPGESLEARRALEDELKALNDTLIQQQKLVDVLEREPMGSTEGFSEHLAALARQHGDGLWLTRMLFHGGSGEMELVGTSIDPELVPQYFQRLGDERALEGQRFDILAIERAEAAANVTFRVSSKSLEEPRAQSRFASRPP